MEVVGAGPDCNSASRHGLFDDFDTFWILSPGGPPLRCRAMPRPVFVLHTFLATAAFVACGWAADPTPTPTPAPTPVPNTVDLSKFKGRYRGDSKVSLDSGVLYTGSSKTHIGVRTLTSLKIDIDATIRADGRTISIGNQLTFTADGVVKGRDLAPGVVDGSRFNGIYTASERRIDFSGTYQLRELTGRFSGILTAGKLGRFKLRYSVFPGTSTTAAYVYQYFGTIPGGKKTR
jgi:hypothetical protein